LERESNNRLSNNFDVIRLVLAIFVVLVHTFHHTKIGDFALFGNYLSADYSVKGFFIISGYLIYRSLERSKDLTSYVVRRIARLYPAYLLVILICALVSAWVVDGELAERNFFKYLAVNAIFLNFLQPSIDGVLVNHHVQAFNGALWTLKIEVMFYALVPMLFLVKERLRLAVIVCLFVASTGYYLLFEYLISSLEKPSLYTLQKQLPGQLRYFCVGMFAAVNFQNHVDKGSLPTLFLVPCVLVFFPGWQVEVFKPVLLGFILFYLAFSFPIKIDLRRLGDMSYGVYIYHSPLLQLAIGLGFFAEEPWVSFSLFLLVLGVLAQLSWRLIEFPSIQLSMKKTAT
jgi:peptidoglycan/LPS O-acetylase OafA/YrhL